MTFVEYGTTNSYVQVWERRHHKMGIIFEKLGNFIIKLMLETMLLEEKLHY